MLDAPPEANPDTSPRPPAVDHPLDTPTRCGYYALEVLEQLGVARRQYDPGLGHEPTLTPSVAASTGTARAISSADCSAWQERHADLRTYSWDAGRPTPGPLPVQAPSDIDTRCLNRQVPWFVVM
jgi:hypothetical protein